MLCQNNTRMVHAIRDQHPGRFDVSLRPRDDHLDELVERGIESHGVVCIDQAGETLWQHGDHQLSQSELDAGLKTVLSRLQQ